MFFHKQNVLILAGLGVRLGFKVQTHFTQDRVSRWGYDYESSFKNMCVRVCVCV